MAVCEVCEGLLVLLFLLLRRRRELYFYSVAGQLREGQRQAVGEGGRGGASHSDLVALCLHKKGYRDESRD